MSRSIRLNRSCHLGSAGFGVIEVLLVCVLVGLLAYVGYTIDKNYHKMTPSNPAQTASSTTISSPDAGWLSSSLRFEKLSFMYPSTWPLTNNSTDNATSDSVICVHPGTDSATLAAPSGESVIMDTGVACSVKRTTQVASIPINALGSPHYISILNNDSASANKNPTEACLSTSATSFAPPSSRNIFINKGVSGKASNILCFSNSAAGSGTYVHKMLSQIKTDPNFVTAVQLFKSLKY